MPGKKVIAIWTRVLVVCLVISLVLSGCSLLSNDQSPKESAGPKIGLITSEEGTTDPYYQKAWDGLQKAQQDLKVQIGYVKVKNSKDYPAKLNQLKNEKYELIFTVGQDAVPAVLEAAKQNPKIKYICLDSNIEGTIPANVLGVTYQVEEAAFLAGYLAGKVTDSGVAGFISGDNKEAALRYYYGYKAGLRYANSYCELMKGIAGTFTNQNRVSEMAERMTDAKADVIFHVAGTAGKGLIKVMDKQGGYAIGTYIDQSKLAPESVLTSVIINNDQVTYELVKRFRKTNLLLGKIEIYGLDEEGVGLAETTKDMVSDDIYNKMVQLQDKIINDQLSIPSNETEYLKF